jgi:hypothetical protein
MEKSKCKWCQTPYETHGPLGLFSSSFCSKKCEHEYDQSKFGNNNNNKKESSKNISEESSNSSNEKSYNPVPAIAGLVILGVGIWFFTQTDNTQSLPLMSDKNWGGTIFTVMGIIMLAGGRD